MKKLQQITALVLSFVLVATIFCSADVSAKGNTLKVSYKGKTVTLIKDADKRDATITLKELQKQWGKAKAYTEKDWYWTDYTYQKGKTKIVLSDNDVKKGKFGGMSIHIDDKNGALAGVKVGMTKAKAVSILKKAYGAKAVHTTKSEITVDFDPYMPLMFTLKSGKVSAMTWFRS